MATKKQKRQAALEKREAFLAEERERSLAAQKADKEHQQEEQAGYVRAAQAEARRLNNILAKALVADLNDS